MAKVFLKPTFGSGSFYVSREVAMRSPLLEQIILKQEEGYSTPEIVEVELDVHGIALGMVLEHCERHVKSNFQGELTGASERTDREFVDGLETEPLLRLIGVSHRLGVLSLLALAAERAARCMADRQAGSEWSELMMHVEPVLQLSEMERDISPKEYIFTPPEADPDEMESGLAFVTVAAAQPVKPRSLMAMGVVESTPAPSRRQPCRLVELLGSEAALSACLERLEAVKLQELKGLSRLWRRRARAALCSGAWREFERSSSTIDLGCTRHWSAEQRCAAANFLSDGGCALAMVLKADGFEADLPSLLTLHKVNSLTLLHAVRVNPCTESRVFDADALCAQNEFLGYLAVWLLGSSTVLRDADLGALTYSGLQPLRAALAPAVEMAASRHCLQTLTLSKCPLDVPALLGMRRGATGSTVDAIELKWQRLGGLDATLIGTLMRTNRSLTRLDVSWNTDLSTGAADLTSAVAACKGLRDVDLSETSLGDAAVDDLCRAISDNHALTRLSLRGCGMGFEAREHVRKALAKRTSPLELMF